MKNMIFATVNGNNILGDDILSARKRLLAENEGSNSFALKENADNNSFLNAEALQKLIEIHSLVALAKFEGISVSEDEISKALFDARSSYTNDEDWEYALQNFGLDNKKIREIFYTDMMIDLLMQSYISHLDQPNDDDAKKLYEENMKFMKTENLYTFIEIEASSLEKTKLAATILSENDTAKIAQEAEKLSLEFKLNEDIPEKQLPNSLQSVLADLEESKIGTMALEENSILLIKLLQKIPGKILSLDESLSGLKEYLRIEQYKETLNHLKEEAMEKCEILYHNTDALKKLS